MTGQVNNNLERKAFGGRLQSTMHAKRMGAETLAVKAGLSVRLVKKYLAGDSAPMNWFGDPTTNAHKLADALEVPIEILVPQRSDDPDPIAA